MRCVYVIRNLTNGKVYVGQTKNFAQRKARHVYAMRKQLDRPLYRSMRKHGIENFVFEIIEECVDELINEREQFWVGHFNSFNPEKGYNLTSGGDVGTNVSDETRKKLSTALRGKAKSSIHRENISRSRKGWKGLCGERNPNYGIHLSESTRQKLKEAAQGKRVGEKNANAFLTEQDVKRIKQRLNEGARICDIVREFNISRSQASRIKCNKQWKHVKI